MKAVATRDPVGAADRALLEELGTRKVKLLSPTDSGERSDTTVTTNTKGKLLRFRHQTENGWVNFRLEGSSDTSLGKFAVHAAARSYSSAGRAAGVALETAGGDIVQGMVVEVSGGDEGLVAVQPTLSAFVTLAASGISGPIVRAAIAELGLPRFDPGELGRGIEVERVEVVELAEVG